jgi:hypothetical protein
LLAIGGLGFWLVSATLERSRSRKVSIIRENITV